MQGREEPIDLEAFRRRLLEEREEILKASASALEDRKPVELDQQSVGRLSRMDALQVQAMALATEERRRLRRRQIEAALRRIESDDYGYCLSCGEEIPAKRLEIDPTAPRCVDCAAET